MALQQEHELRAIAAVNGQLARPLLGVDDIQRRRDLLNTDDRLVDLIGSRYSKFQVMASHQLG